MDFMPHMEQYSVMYSQREGTLELIICVILPGIPSLLNYCFLIQYKFAFHCFWWTSVISGQLKIPFQEFPLIIYNILVCIIGILHNLERWPFDIRFINYSWNNYVEVQLQDIQINRKILSLLSRSSRSYCGDKLYVEV